MGVWESGRASGSVWKLEWECEWASGRVCVGEWERVGLCESVCARLAGWMGVWMDFCYCCCCCCWWCGSTEPATSTSPPLQYNSTTVSIRLPLLLAVDARDAVSHAQSRTLCARGFLDRADRCSQPVLLGGKGG